MKVNMYSTKGVKKGSFDLPREVGEKVNLPLLAQAVYVYRDNTHFGLGKTKSRGEVSISTRKIYRQKGTGGARHGAKSAPIFVGGGTAHGKKGIKRKLVLSKKMRLKALNSALALKARENSLGIVDGIDSIKKTKDANMLLAKIESSEKVNKTRRFSLVVAGKVEFAIRAFRNIKNVKVLSRDNLNAHDVVVGGFLLVDKAIFDKVKPTSSKENTKKSVIAPAKEKTKSAVKPTKKRSSKK
ncbi:50S ribosomal protein L4 [Candidatus Woesebacteria bacterium GWA1_41_8]|jgi:large subunit ribosomal protein L4|uniref:Large ribosomal subunit protein uL4 n=1 Tax=Candidatus Woesebacteria bacterium GWA1_41_8 TaxID=1802471 RepID=A0A1F7WIX8_9BACT|nr:MAG: 50S ribosomal protein L4 [Candidatus Woesebacteria bacterium GWA1_41_8]